MWTFVIRVTDASCWIVLLRRGALLAEGLGTQETSFVLVPICMPHVPLWRRKYPPRPRYRRALGDSRVFVGVGVWYPTSAIRTTTVRSGRLWLCYARHGLVGLAQYGHTVHSDVRRYGLRLITAADIRAQVTRARPRSTGRDLTVTVDNSTDITRLRVTIGEHETRSIRGFGHRIRRRCCSAVPVYTSANDAPVARGEAPASSTQSERAAPSDARHAGAAPSPARPAPGIATRSQVDRRRRSQADRVWPSRVRAQTADGRCHRR